MPQCDQQQLVQHPPVASGFHSAARGMKPARVRETLDRFFEESRGRRSLSITFFGGEPLLNFRAIEVGVEYALERAAAIGVSLGFTITTNLTLLTPDIADFLVEHKFAVMVSLDGSENDNDRYRVTKDGHGTYAAVVRNLKMLLGKQQAAGVRPAKLRATMTPENANGDAIEQHLKSLGTDLVVVGESSGTASTSNAWDLGEREWTEASRERHRMAARYLEFLGHRNSQDVTPREFIDVFAPILSKIHEEANRTIIAQKVPFPICGVCRNMKAVTPTGDVYPCHRYVGNENFKLGNLDRGGVDMQKIARYYAAVHDVFELKCRGCWARRLCGGQCPWYLSSADGQMVVPDEPGCKSIRSGYELALSLYTMLSRRFPEELKRILSAEAVQECGAEDTSGDKSLPTLAQDACSS